jgi:hypothetical protein
MVSCSSSEGPRIQAIAPDQGSARGQAEILITGQGFKTGAEVWFDDEQALAVVWISAGELRVTTPVMQAGSKTVTVANPDGQTTSRVDGFMVNPLSLRFIEAAAHYLPDLSGLAITDAKAGDFNGDGAPDLLIAVKNGLSRILLNNGAGTFTDTSTEEEPLLAGWINDTRQVVVHDFDGDGNPDIFVCNASGQGNRYFRTVDGSGIEDATALPPDSDSCVRAVAADLNRDGLKDLVMIGVAEDGQTHHLRVYLNNGNGTFRVAEELEDPQDVEGRDVGSVWASDPAVAGSYTMTHEVASGGMGAGRMDYDFSAAEGYLLFRVPGPTSSQVPWALETSVLGDGSGHGIKLCIIDSADERFVYDLGVVDWSGWRRIRVEGISEWDHVLGNEDGLVDVPVSWVALEIHSTGGAPSAGTVYVDDTVLEYPEGGYVLVEDYERKVYAHSWPDIVSSLSAADVNGSGNVDLVLSSSQSGDGACLRLLLGQLESTEPAILWLSEVVLDIGATPGCDISQAVAFDVEGDGDADLLLVSDAGQDRLLINDGFGHYFDNTTASMPVDRADGRSAALADLDLDGLIDVVIANHGAQDRIYVNHGDGSFMDRTTAMPLSDAPSVLVLTLDIEGDGDLDLVVVSGSQEGVKLYVSVERTAP